MSEIKRYEEHPDGGMRPDELGHWVHIDDFIMRADKPGAWISYEEHAAFAEALKTERLHERVASMRTEAALRAAAFRLIKAVEDVDLARSIHNDRKPDQRIEGNVWVEIMKASRALDAAISPPIIRVEGENNE